MPENQRIKVALEGEQQMRKRLEHLASDKGMRKELRAAATEVGGEKLEVAKDRAPYKTGRLRNSAKLKVMVSSKKEDIRIALIFGGPEAPYAVRVHESHPTQSKFLESVLLESARTIAAELGAKIDLEAAVP